MTDFRAIPTQKFEHVANFRDLGGHTTHDGRRVASGRLLRSGHLGRASDSDLEILAAFGLRCIFDFRSAGDIELEGADRLPPTAESLRLPMPDPAKGHDIRKMMEESSQDQLDEVFGNGQAERMMSNSAASLVRERREPYGIFLKALASARKLPALFHCSAGKDRAGWAGSVALLTLGVPEDQVIEQYLLSNRAAEQLIKQFSTDENESMRELFQPLIGVREEYIQASFDAVHEDWGDFEGYLRDGLGITDADRDAIRHNLLE